MKYNCGRVVTLNVREFPRQIPSIGREIWSAYAVSDVPWEFSHNGIDWFPVEAFDRIELPVSNLETFQFNGRNATIKLFLMGP
jgi:hypothetical protein